MSNTDFNKQKKLITIVSVVLPLAVAALFGIKIEGYDFSFLPSIYASINGMTAILLVMALVMIKNKKVKQHELLIKICMVLSLVFLLMYVVYHATSDATSYGGSHTMRNFVYLPVLVSHILLSIIVVPLVLFAYLYGINNVIEKHKKIVKFTFPIWLYVAVSGVIVYLMISPYYS